VTWQHHGSRLWTVLSLQVPIAQQLVNILFICTLVWQNVGNNVATFPTIFTFSPAYFHRRDKGCFSGIDGWQAVRPNSAIKKGFVDVIGQTVIIRVVDEH
jgi:hypothetical protein